MIDRFWMDGRTHFLIDGFDGFLSDGWTNKRTDVLPFIRNNR